MMRCRFFTMMTAALLAAALATPAAAQTKPAQKPQTPPPPPQMQEPPPPIDPNKPYKPVAVTLPAQANDPGLADLRKQLGEVARKKDRAALARLVVSKGFFWERETGDRADKKKPGVDNLSVALGLTNKDGAGWDMLAGYSEDPTASQSMMHKEATCAPADPGFNGKDMEALLEATQSDIAEWGYPVTDGVQVRDKPQAQAAVTTKLGLNFIRVVPDSNPSAAVGSFIRVVTPDGKFGYVATDDIAPLGNDQLCYVKEGGAWKIGGYVGGGDTQ
jgi:hypothetical protein